MARCPETFGAPGLRWASRHGLQVSPSRARQPNGTIARDPHVWPASRNRSGAAIPSWDLHEADTFYYDQARC